MPATKNDVQKMILEAADAILKGVETLFAEHEKHTNKRFSKLESKLQTEIAFVRRDLQDLKHDTPSRKEFEEHTKQITRLEKAVTS